MNNLITIAVLENKPELITSQPHFEASLLNESSCSISSILVSECAGLNCGDCPFFNVSKNTLNSAKQWLKLEPLEQSTKGVVIDTLLKCCSPEQSTQPITYTEQEVLALCKRSYNLRTIDEDVRSTKSFEEWFNNNKKK